MISEGTVYVVLGYEPHQNFLVWFFHGFYDFFMTLVTYWVTQQPFGGFSESNPQTGPEALEPPDARCSRCVTCWHLRFQPFPSPVRLPGQKPRLFRTGAVSELQLNSITRSL